MQAKLISILLWLTALPTLLQILMFAPDTRLRVEAVLCLVLLSAFTALLSITRFVRVKSNTEIGSMAPTLHVGDLVLMNTAVRQFNQRLNKGDIVLFTPPRSFIEASGETSEFIKRVIGISGDTIRIETGVGVFVNGQLLPEAYAHGLPAKNMQFLADIGGNSSGVEFHPFAHQPNSEQLPITVPADHVFVLGDNRPTSIDSRTFGFVECKLVHAKYLVTLWRGPQPTLLNEPVPEGNVSYCSFCKRPNTEVEYLMAHSPELAICSTCISSEPSSAAEDAAPQSCSFCESPSATIAVQANDHTICSTCFDYCNTVFKAEQAIKLTPDNDTGYAMRAQSNLLSGLTDLAYADISKAIEISPDNAEHLLLRAGIHSRRDNHALVVHDLTTVLRLDKANVDAFSLRGYHLLQLGRFEEAIADCTRVIELTPDEPTAYNNRGKARLQLKQFDAAVVDLDAAIELDNTSYPIFYYNRGSALAGSGNNSKAVEDFTYAIGLDNSQPNYYAARAAAYEKLGDDARAQTDRQTAEGLSAVQAAVPMDAQNPDNSQSPAAAEDKPGSSR